MYGKDMAHRMLHDNPGATWAIDLHACPPDDKGNVWLLVAKDLCTRFVFTVPLTNKDQRTVIDAIFKEVVSKVGYNIAVMVDQGSEFINEFGNLSFHEYGIQVIIVDRAQAQENGSVERWNRIFVDHFRAALHSRQLTVHQWSTWLHKLTSVYNNTYNPAIGHTPYYRLWHREFQGPLSAFAMLPTRGTLSAADQVRANKLEDDAFKQILRRNYAALQHHLEIYNMLFDSAPKCKSGDLVLLKCADSNSNEQTSNKLRNHAGPFEIVQQESSYSYLICGADREAVPVHPNKLVKYTPSLADLNGTDKLFPSARGAALDRFLHFQETAAGERVEMF